MPIERIESNFRLLQDRPAADRRGAAEALSQLPDTRAQGVTELIRTHDLDNEV
jgi:predicted FMN-binding regulatory protein PaiB